MYAAQFHIQAFGEAVDPGLRRAITHVAGALPECRDGRNADDAASPARDHLSQRRVREPHGRHDVNFVHPFLALDIRLPESPECSEPGVVDEQFEPRRTPG